MFKGFHTFQPYHLSAPCQYVSHLFKDNTLCREGSSALFYDSEVWNLPPTSPTLVWRFFTRWVHLRSQDSSYGGWLLSSGLLAASSLRCNRNNPIKWWIAFHTDYWASVTPAGGGRDKVATAGTHTCAHTSVPASRQSWTHTQILQTCSGSLVMLSLPND